MSPAVGLSRVAVAALLASLLVGCRSPAAQPAATEATAPTSGTDTTAPSVPRRTGGNVPPACAGDAVHHEVSSAVSPFHLAVREPERRQEVPATFLRLCPLEGRTFVCGTDHLLFVDGDDVRYDPALEAGLPRDDQGRLAAFPYKLVGVWPSQAWLALADLGVGSPRFSVYRWSESQWSRVASELRNWLPLRMALYAGGLLVQREEWSLDDDGPTRSWLQTFGAGVPAPPARVSDLATERPEGTLATVGDTVFAIPPSDDVRVARWAPGNNAATVDVLSPSEGVASLAVCRRDVIAFGSIKVGEREDKTFLSVFDGQRWTRGVAPPGTSILSYARSSGGSEWAVARTDPVPRGTHAAKLWRRSPGGAWSAVEMPLLDRVPDVLAVWSAGDEAWTVARYQNCDSGATFSALLRTGPVRAPRILE